MKFTAKTLLLGLALSLPTFLCSQEAAEKPSTPEASSDKDNSMVELTLELPTPLFVGTPKNIVSDNLEEPGTKREPLMVPADVELISLDKYVTSSDEEPIIGDAELITDGDKDGGDGYYVEFGPDKQWVQIDLEDKFEIYAVVVWHFHSNARAFHDVVVQVADDEDMIENVQTIYNNDHDNSIGLGVGKDKEWIETYEGRLMDAKGAKGQFVRLYSNGSTASPMNHYVEVEVYGRPVK